MVDTFTALLRLVKQETGGNENVWGDFLNAQMIDLIDTAVAGFQDVDVTLSNQTLTAINGDVDTSRAAILVATGAPPDSSREIQVPSTSKVYILSNETTGGFDVTFKTASNPGVIVSPGETITARVDATNDDVVKVQPPQATETVQGIAELATQAEVDAGTDTERIITPATLAAFPAVNTATETQEGVAEIATQAETDDQSSPLDDKIITPLKLNTRRSTTTLWGISRRATQAEVDAGTETEAFITPATLSGSPVGVLNGCKVYKTAGFRAAQNNQPDIGQASPGPGDGSGAGNAVGEQILDFNAEVFDTNSYHDTVSNNSRFTIPSSGVSAVEFIIGYRIDDETSTPQGGGMHIRLRKNGVVNGAVDSLFVVTHNGADPGWIPWNTDTLFGTQEVGGNESGQAGLQQWYSGTIFVDPDDYIEIAILSQASFRDIPPNGIWAEMRVIG